MIKKLLQSVREFKTPSILSPVFVTFEVLLEVIMPFLMKRLIDLGVEAGDMNVVWQTGLQLFLCAVLALIFGVLSGRYAAIASAGFGRNLRHDMFEHVQKFSFSNIDHYSTAGIVTRLTTDVSNIQNAYQMSIRMAVRSPVMLVFSLVMAFRMNDRLAWIFVAFIPILTVGLGLMIRYAHPIFARVFQTYDKLNGIVQENLRGIRVVKSFDRQAYETDKFEKVSKSIHDDFCFAEKLLALAMPLMQFCLYAGMLLVSWFGAKMIVSSEMTTGDLMSLITYAMQILISLMMLSMIFVMVIISRASAERISGLLSEQPDLVSPEHPVTTVPDGSVTFEKVSFRYGKKAKRPVLKDVNVNIPSGATVGILGVTGSSKSSMVQLIPRLYDVSEGRVLVGGLDVREYDLTVLRDAVAMVLQKNVLFSGTIRENLRWGNADASEEEMRNACKIAQAHDFIMSFPQQYDTVLEQGGVNVSGGQRQRLCIARALLKKPKILILDDSTSAVDTKTDAAIRTAFKEQLPQTTKLIIAQRVTSVMSADMILLLDNGQIVAQGTHEELLKSDSRYQEIWKAQQKEGGHHE